MRGVLRIYCRTNSAVKPLKDRHHSRLSFLKHCRLFLIRDLGSDVQVFVFLAPVAFALRLPPIVAVSATVTHNLSKSVRFLPKGRCVISFLLCLTSSPPLCTGRCVFVHKG